MTKFRKAGTRSALRRFKEPITSINSTNGICYYHAAKAGAILNGTRRARQIGVEIRSTRKTGSREIRRICGVLQISAAVTNPRPLDGGLARPVNTVVGQVRQDRETDKK